ncbi:MAG: hypothetical protein AAFY34_14565, partial [Pseudomonadota bacterium]
PLSETLNSNAGPIGAQVIPDQDSIDFNIKRSPVGAPTALRKSSGFNSEKSFNLHLKSDDDFPEGDYVVEFELEVDNARTMES